MTTEEMVAAAKAVVPAVTVQEVQAKLQAGERVVVLDVREKEEYDQGHIPQATLLPRGLLEFRYRDILPDLTTNIILHWRLDGRSALAGQTLQQLGFQRVAFMVGGFTAWSAAQLPVAGKPISPA
jgi:rhodanese-related sulfurtransferase